MSSGLQAAPALQSAAALEPLLLLVRQSRHLHSPAAGSLRRPHFRRFQTPGLTISPPTAVLCYTDSPRRHPPGPGSPAPRRTVHEHLRRPPPTSVEPAETGRAVTEEDCRANGPLPLSLGSARGRRRGCRLAGAPLPLPRSRRGVRTAQAAAPVRATPDGQKPETLPQQPRAGERGQGRHGPVLGKTQPWPLSPPSLAHVAEAFPAAFSHPPASLV